MTVRTIEGMVIETEPDEEEIVAVAIETDTETYLVAPEEMVEQFLDLMGHHVEATGIIIEEEDKPPVIEVEAYTEIYDDASSEEEEDDDEDFVADDHHLHP